MSNSFKSLKARAVEAEEKFQGIKGKLDDVYKKQDDNVVKRLKIKANGKTFGRKPTKRLKTKDQQIADLERQLVELRTSKRDCSNANFCVVCN